MPAEKRFQVLRKQLADEGYPLVFGPEAAPLVHRLWDDLRAVRGESAVRARLRRRAHTVSRHVSWASDASVSYIRHTCDAGAANQHDTHAIPEPKHA